MFSRITTTFAVLSLFMAMSFATYLYVSPPQAQAIMAVDPNANKFVRKVGTKFYFGGQEFKFVGFNIFDAVGAGNAPYSCLQQTGWWTKFSDEEIDTALKTMRAETGSTVLRFWAFQKYTKGGTDWSGIDKIISVAKANGFKVMPVLEDGPGYCTEPGGGGNAHVEKWKYNNDSWYTDGYKVVNAPYTLSYRDYVRAIVTRYKDEPAILAWTLMNEADTSKKVTINGQQKSALVPFTEDMGVLVKGIDSNHMLTVGTQSNGASGATGQDFIDVYGSPYIDFAVGHDWGYWGNDDEAIPGGIKNADGSMALPNPLSTDCLKTYQAKIGCSLAQATQVVNKPIVFTEVGIAAADATGRTRRAQLMDKKMAAFFGNGGSGYLYWQWNKVLDSQKYDVLPNTQDPLLPVMKKYAGTQIALKTGAPIFGVVASPKASPTSSPVASPVASPEASPPNPGACIADFNDDNMVDVLDFTIMKRNFFKQNFPDMMTDLNRDNIVNVLDFHILRMYFLKPC